MAHGEGQKASREHGGLDQATGRKRSNWEAEETNICGKLLKQ